MTAPRAPGSAVVRAARTARRAINSVFAALGLALGGIFFIPRPWIGLVLWLAFLRNPRHAAFALLGLVVGALGERLLRAGEGPDLGGGIKANALLTAVVTGWMTGTLALSWGEQLLLAAAAAALAALLAAALMHVLSRSVLPPLLWAYCLVAAMLFAVCPQCTVRAASAMPAWPLPADAAGWGLTFLRSMGSLMYSADPATGVFVCLGIVLWSRTVFISGVVGWICGVLVALVFRSMNLAYDWLPLSYNYFIAGMALGAVIFVPGRLSLPVAAAAGSVTAVLALVLQYALQWSAASYLPLSSSLAIWVGIGALTLGGDRAPVTRNASQQLQPEQRWWQLAYWTARFGAYAPLFAVPVPGVLQVSQGFGGKLSHQGAFSHALDFQRPRALEASAGPVWAAAVTSPVAGTVERVRNTVPDNPLGVCNYAEIWGNYVVIRLDSGGWALLAHLQQGTIAVAPGAHVETGSYLGRVGNSGRSAVPHLHVHYQDGPDPGSPTRRFRLANYQCAPQPRAPLRAWKASGVPAEGDLVMAAAANTPVYLALVGMAPGSAVWVAEATGRIPRKFRPRAAGLTYRIDVSLDSMGRHVLDAGREGRLVAGLDPDAWRVFEVTRLTSPILRLLALAIPSVPYAARAGMVWSDLAPTMPPGGWLRSLVLALAPYFSRPFLRVSCACVAEPGPNGEPLEVASRVESGSSALPSKVSCQIAAYRGPVKIRADFKRGCLTFSLLSYEPAAPGAPGDGAHD